MERSNGSRAEGFQDLPEGLRKSIRGLRDCAKFGEKLRGLVEESGGREKSGELAAGYGCVLNHEEDFLLTNELRESLIDRVSADFGFMGIRRANCLFLRRILRGWLLYSNFVAG